MTYHPRLTTGLLYALLALVSIPALATSYTLGGGEVHFSVPDNWPMIMEQMQGDPQFIAFQVPDVSPSGKRVLSRATVTAQQVADIAKFRSWVKIRARKSHKLPDYKAGKRQNPRRFVYHARENGLRMRYYERYYFKNGYAVQLRCLRPQHDQSGQAWQSAFDRGCKQIARSLDNWQ